MIMMLFDVHQYEFISIKNVYLNLENKYYWAHIVICYSMMPIVCNNIQMQDDHGARKNMWSDKSDSDMSASFRQQNLWDSLVCSMLRYCRNVVNSTMW